MSEDQMEVVEKLWDDELETADITGLSAEELEQLIHTLTARRLVEALRNPVLGRTHSTLSNARGFLKDNEVTGLDIPGSSQENLRKALALKVPFPKMTGS